jgi:hypothetical protein
MSSVSVLIRAGNVGERVMRQPVRASAPVSEADEGFAVSVSRRSPQASFSLLNEPRVDRTCRHPVEPGEAAIVCNSLNPPSNHPDAALVAALSLEMPYIRI